MADALDVFENAIINHFLRGSSQSTTSAFVGFLSTNPTNDAGAGLVEISTSGTNYARVAAALGAPSGGVATNSAQIDFAQSVSGYNLPIAGVGLWNASTGGSLLAFKAISPSKTIGAGDTPRINAGDLDFEVL